MAGTTSLSDLPVSPQTDNNIKFETTDKNKVITNTAEQLSKQREAEDKKTAGLMQQQNVSSGTLPPPGGNPQSLQSPPPQNTGAPLPPSTSSMNEFVNGIQTAAASGALGLPSRDIPHVQTHITQDAVTQPNYVPTGPDDYILKHQTQEEIISKHAERANTETSVDKIYDELQGPILIAVLYFLFQLPVVKKQFMYLLPSLFLKDGNLKLAGYIVSSIAFSGLYYSSSQTIQYLSI